MNHTRRGFFGLLAATPAVATVARQAAKAVPSTPQMTVVQNIKRLAKLGPLAPWHFRALVLLPTHRAADMFQRDLALAVRDGLVCVRYSAMEVEFASRACVYVGHDPESFRGCRFDDISIHADLTPDQIAMVRATLRQPEAE